MPKESKIYTCMLGDMRYDHGISQHKLANAIGVSRQTISSIERRTYEPSISVALKLARYFNMPVEMLFELNEQPSNKSPTDSLSDQNTAATYVERWAREEVR